MKIVKIFRLCVLLVVAIAVQPDCHAKGLQNKTTAAVVAPQEKIVETAKMDVPITIEQPVAEEGQIPMGPMTELATAKAVADRVVAEAPVAMDDARKQLIAGQTTAQDAVKTIVEQTMLIAEAQHRVTELIAAAKTQSEEGWYGYLAKQAKKFGTRAMGVLKGGYGYSEEEKNVVRQIIALLTVQKEKMRDEYAEALKQTQDRVQLKGRYEMFTQLINDEIDRQKIEIGEKMSTVRKTALFTAGFLGSAMLAAKAGNKYLTPEALTPINENLIVEPNISGLEVNESSTVPNLKVNELPTIIVPSTIGGVQPEQVSVVPKTRLQETQEAKKESQQKETTLDKRIEGKRETQRQKLLKGIEEAKEKEKSLLPPKLQPEQVQMQEPEQVQMQEPEQVQMPEPEQVQMQEPEQVQMQEPEQVQMQEPEQVQMQEPEQVQMQEPEQVQMQEPEQVQMQEPEQVQMQEPEQVQMPEPEQVQMPEPEQVQMPEPEQVQMQEPEQVQMQEPEQVQMPEPEQVQMPEPEQVLEEPEVQIDNLVERARREVENLPIVHRYYQILEERDNTNDVAAIQRLDDEKSRVWAEIKQTPEYEDFKLEENLARQERVGEREYNATAGRPFQTEATEENVTDLMAPLKRFEKKQEAAEQKRLVAEKVAQEEAKLDTFMKDQEGLEDEMVAVEGARQEQERLAAAKRANEEAKLDTFMKDQERLEDEMVAVEGARQEQERLAAAKRANEVTDEVKRVPDEQPEEDLGEEVGDEIDRSPIDEEEDLANNAPTDQDLDDLDDLEFVTPKDNAPVTEAPIQVPVVNVPVTAPIINESTPAEEPAKKRETPLERTKRLTKERQEREVQLKKKAAQKKEEARQALLKK